MKRLLVVVLLFPGAGLAQAEDHDGYWWAGSGPIFKLGFVSGYVEAMGRVQEATQFQCLADNNGGPLPDKYPGDDAIKACLHAGARYDFTEIRFGQVGGRR